MKLDRARQSAEAQQAQQATGSQEAHRHRHGHGGYAGGMHKGVAYRHAPRAQLPAKRNTGPAPRARLRPASSAAAGAHHDEEHPRSLADDPWTQGGGAGMSLMGGSSGLGGGVAGTASQNGQRSSLAQREDPSGARAAADAPAPPPPPRQPPVQEGAALRRSRMPEAALLRSPLENGSSTPVAVLLNAYASVYFQGGRAATPTGGQAHGGAETSPLHLAALRMAAKAALMRHLPTGAPATTLADIRASCVAWCQSHGRPPASTEAQRNANLLFPLDAFRAMFRPGAASPAGEAKTQQALTAPQPLNVLLQRAFEVHTTRKDASS